jgi:carbon-monoxide dehydrogenase medium subunit
MRDFILLEPQSLHEAGRMLADSGEESRLFAGGTALLLAMRQRMLTPSHLISLGGVGALRGIAYDDHNGLRIGALTRHAEIADSPIIRAKYPMLADMAGQVANPQIRNQGTLGGNLCYGDPSTDPPTCLMALDATVHISGINGERTNRMTEFCVDYFQTSLAPDEIVTEIRLPPPVGAMTGAYTRFRRTAAEHRPLVGCGVVLFRNGDACREARIAIGASVPVPARAKQAEEFLAGKTFDRDTVLEAAVIAAAYIEPISDFRGSAEYRRDMVRIVAGRTIAAACGIALE